MNIGQGASGLWAESWTESFGKAGVYSATAFVTMNGHTRRQTTGIIVSKKVATSTQAPPPTELSLSFDRLRTATASGRIQHRFRIGETAWANATYTLQNPDPSQTLPLHVVQSYAYWSSSGHRWIPGRSPYHVDYVAEAGQHTFATPYTVPPSLAPDFTSIRITDTITVQSITRRRSVKIAVRR